MERLEYIENKVRDKEVLHIGCTFHPDYINGFKKDAKIREVSKNYLGTDIEIDAIKYFRERNCNVIYNDIMRINTKLINRFDIVLLPEVLEHLENIKDALYNVRQYKKKDGFIIVTLPNVYSLNRVVYKGLVEKRKDHYQHVTCHSMQTATQLFIRCGFEIIERGFINGKDSFRNKIYSKIKPSYSTNMYFLLK